MCVRAHSHRFVKPGVKEDVLAKHLLEEWVLPRLEDQYRKICQRMDISPDAPRDPKFARMSVSFDGCGPFLFHVADKLKNEGKIGCFTHWLKLVAGGTGCEKSGQENDMADAFPHFKKDAHTRDKRYLEMFIKKDPLAQTDMHVLTKATSFWESFRLKVCCV